MNYQAIWGYDGPGSWEFYGYAPGVAVEQVRRALNGMRISRGRGPQSFWAYPSPYPIGGVRWPAPPWFEVSASSGYPPDVRVLTWGRYYQEPHAWAVAEGLRKLNIQGLIGAVDYAPHTGAFA